MCAGGEEEVLLADDGLDASSDDLALRSSAPGADDELLAEDDEAMLVDEEPEPASDAGDEPLPGAAGPGSSFPHRRRWTATAMRCRTRPRVASARR